MSWQLVARKDFEDVVRSWMLWTILGVSLSLLAIVTFGVATDNLDEIGQELVYVLFNSLGSQLVVPITALIFGYMSVAGERQSGTLRVLFGLSHGRRDVLAGKLASRTSVMVFVALLSSVFVAGLILLLFGSLDVGLFLGFLALTVLLAVTFTGIAVSISAATGTRSRAMGAAIGSYVGFMLLWHPLVAMVHYAVEGELAGISPPDWYLFLLMLNPLTAYRELLGQLAGRYLSPLIGWTSIVEDISRQAITGPGARLVTNRAGGAFYASEPFGVLVLLAWFAVPVALGYWRFEGADLN